MSILMEIPWRMVIHLAFVLAAFTFLTWACRSKSLPIQSFFHLLFIGCAYLMFTHKLPWVENKLIFNQVVLSPEAAPYTMYLNYDKPFVGLLIFWVLGFGPGRFHRIKIYKWTAMTLVPCAITLMAVAYQFNYIQFSAKLPSEGLVWALNNFFIVCFAEECFFRRYIQGGLSAWLSTWEEYERPAKIFALVVASLAFGLAHYQGGAQYVILSSIAGLFYGFAYMQTQRLEAAILVHFLSNCLHFFFFTYPYKSLI